MNSEEKIVLCVKKFPNVFSLTVTLLLFSQLAASAGYTPPQPPTTPTKVTGTTTGTRGGCSGETAADLTAIAPMEHVGKSSSGHPSFVWFVPDQETFEVEFRLYELEAAVLSDNSNLADNSKSNLKKNRILTQTFESQTGWMKFELPSTMEALSPSKNYLWSVILHCNPNRPSRSQRIDAELKVQLPGQALTQQLDAISDVATRSQFWAQQGYWYDAMGLLTSASGADASGTKETATGVSAIRTDLVTALSEMESEARQQQLIEILRLED